MENIYSQSDAELESEAAKEQKNMISQKARAARCRGGRLAFVGSSQDLEAISGNMTRQYVPSAPSEDEE